MRQYVAPTVTVDGVVLRLLGEQLEVLLVRREQSPFKGEWALPGSYVSRSETTTQALQRTLHAKAGLDAQQLTFTEQLYTFDTPAMQDPRGHAVSVIYFVLGRGLQPAAGKGESPTFFPVDALPHLAYQHNDVVWHTLERLKGKITYTNIMFALLPSRFTFRQLQTGYQAILGRALDKRNFRKKILELHLIEPTASFDKKSAHRPARLYRFKKQSLESLTRNFD